MIRTLLAASAVALLTAATAQAQDVKIGVLYPITGGGAVYGVPAMTGHRMAVEEVNAAGGILGRKVVSIERDTKLNPSEAAAAAEPDGSRRARVWWIQMYRPTERASSFPR